jgi:hypothetical protein
LLIFYEKKTQRKRFKGGTILVGSDMVGKAMMDLIPFLNMRKLVLGTSKSINPRHIITCNL